MLRLQLAQQDDGADSARVAEEMQETMPMQPLAAGPMRLNIFGQSWRPLPLCLIGFLFLQVVHII